MKTNKSLPCFQGRLLLVKMAKNIPAASYSPIQRANTPLGMRSLTSAWRIGSGIATLIKPARPSSEDEMENKKASPVSREGFYWLI
jgi:hypothetical protein